MTFKDLLHTVSFDDVWKELNKQDILTDGGYEAYRRVFSQLKELMPAQNPDRFRLAIVRIKDELELGTFDFVSVGMRAYERYRGTYKQ